MISSIIEKHAKIISASASVIYGTIGVLAYIDPVLAVSFLTPF